MNCESYLKLIDELIEGELDEKSADEVSFHILSCQNCTTHYEMLEHEKQIYSHYLFEIEPPVDLRRKFESRLVLEEKTTDLTDSAGFWSGIYAFLRLNPSLVTAIILILIAAGFILTNLKTKEGYVEKVETIEPSKFIQSGNDREIHILAQPEKTIDRTVSHPEGKKKIETTRPESKAQPIVVRQTEVPEKSVPRVKNNLPPKAAFEEAERFKQIQALEGETAKQLEKVELLLRAFRNAEIADGSETYDVAYESQQARRLLQNNVALRQKVEIYGTIYTREMLSRVESYLLDIANLDAKPSPEQVMQIKDRVRNQSIIASLQMF